MHKIFPFLFIFQLYFCCTTIRISRWLYVTTLYSEKELRDISFTCVKISRKNVEKITKGKPMNKTFAHFDVENVRLIEHGREQSIVGSSYHVWNEPPSYHVFTTHPVFTVFALEYNMLTYVGYTCIDCVLDEFVFICVYVCEKLSHSLVRRVQCISYII